MFGVLKKIFGKPDSEVPTASVASLTETKPRFGNHPSPKHAPSADDASARTALPTSPGAYPRHVADSDTINIPYAAIVKRVPQELWGRLAPAGVAGLEFSVGRQQVLSQLAQGSVKATFGEIRRRTPKGVFVESTAHDHESVSLPLSEILAQLHPESYARRANQVMVNVPQEVADLFGPRGERLSEVRVGEKKEPTKITTSVTRSPKQSSAVPPEPAAATFRHAGALTVEPVVSAPPVTIAGPMPIRTPVSVQTLAFESAALTSPAEERPETNTTPFSVTTPKGMALPAQMRDFTPPSTKSVAPISKPVASPPPAVPLPKPTPIAPTLPAVPAPVSVNAAPEPRIVSADNGTLLVGLADLADEWAVEIRQEIAQLKCPNPQVALPLADLGQALKRGRVQYTWKQLRAWITPAQFFDMPSPQAEILLDLPMKIITPLYIDKTHGTSFFKKQSYADKIPDVLAKAEGPLAPKLAAPLPLSTSGEPAPAPLIMAPEEPMVPQPPAPRPCDADAVVVDFKVVSVDWPEAIRHEITVLQLHDARLEIPLTVLDRDLKQGRLAYAWKDIQVWLNPPAPDIHTSPNAEAALELPLHEIAPLFFQRRRSLAKNQATIPEDIPDLFASQSQIESASAPSSTLPTQATLATTATQGVTESVAVQAGKAPRTLGELFGVPHKQNWSPNELVQKTTALPGLAGALIALQDGFLVASSLPQGWKAETISAFLPQIVGRMNAYCREIGLGETKSVSFTIDEGTFQIFKAGIIYLAVIARPGAAIPEAAVALIAAELSRHTK